MSDWQRVRPPQTSGLGVMRATCSQCHTGSRMIAMDVPLAVTNARCLTCNPPLPQEYAHMWRLRETIHDCEIFLRPGAEADAFIKEHNLNPPPQNNVDLRKPWEVQSET